jgi:spore coat polysaccharide biosynthesis protein SpsF
MNVVAIIQARMSSKRLPGKVLMNLSKKPVLEHIIDRIKVCKTIDNIVVATSNHASDDKIEKFCNQKHVPIYRGSLDDVLDRFYQAANIYNADAILRITGDCPVIDPEIIDTIVTSFKRDKVDYVDCQVTSLMA